jgi:MraZ protein
MLIGTFHLQIDDNGCVALPEAWRSNFTHGLVLTRGVDKNLLVFPTPKFRAIAEEIGRVGFEPTDARDWSRFLIGSAIPLPINKLGRLAIPESHRLYAELQQDLVMVGVGNRIEIWAAPQYAEYEAKTTPQIVQIAERFDKLVRAAATRQCA